MKRTGKQLAFWITEMSGGRKLYVGPSLHEVVHGIETALYSGYCEDQADAQDATVSPDEIRSRALDYANNYIKAVELIGEVEACY